MISVVVPVYNLEKYINATLDSIISQDVPDMEVLLVDDKSTDSSVSVINDYIASHPDAGIRSTESEGKVKTSGAGELGNHESRGENIAFRDAELRIRMQASGLSSRVKS